MLYCTYGSRKSVSKINSICSIVLLEVFPWVNVDEANKLCKSGADFDLDIGDAVASLVCLMLIVFSLVTLLWLLILDKVLKKGWSCSIELIVDIVSKTCPGVYWRHSSDGTYKM